MNKETVVHFRKATKSDIDFLSHILISAAAASGVSIQIADLSSHPDTFQYVEGFPNGSDIGVVAETQEGIPAGAAWIRLLPMDAHAINEPLPELTMGVVPQYQRMGIGKQLMEELYKAALEWVFLKYHWVCIRIILGQSTFINSKTGLKMGIITNTL